MSDTPRTDALIKSIASIEDRYIPLRELARELERESSRSKEAHAEVLRLAELLRKADPTWGSPMHLNRVLAVGEPCVGGWSGPPQAWEWLCRCGAKSPKQCKTETAKP